MFLQEQLDDVKRMAQMVLHSQCAAGRDAQVEEKKRAAAAAEAERRALDAAMESSRVAALRELEVHSHAPHRSTCIMDHAQIMDQCMQSVQQLT